jgi:hypothetical protein
MSRASAYGGWGLFEGAPGEEEAVGFNVVPIGDGAAVRLAAVAAEEVQEFVAVEPFFPGGGIEAAPVFGVFIDDGEAAAGLEDAAEFGDGGFDIDGVFEGFGGVDAVEGVVLEGEGQEGTGDRLSAGSANWSMETARSMATTVPWGLCSRTMRAKRPLPQPASRARLPAPRGPRVSRTKRTWEMRGSMVEGKCSSSAAESSKERRISEARSGVRLLGGRERPNHFLNSCIRRG